MASSEEEEIREAYAPGSAHHSLHRILLQSLRQGDLIYDNMFENSSILNKDERVPICNKIRQFTLIQDFYSFLSTWSLDVFGCAWSAEDDDFEDEAKSWPCFSPAAACCPCAQDVSDEDAAVQAPVTLRPPSPGPFHIHCC